MFFLGERPWELIISLLDVLENNFSGFWSNVSRIRKVMLSNFLHPVRRKKRLGRSCLCDDLRSRMGLTTLNLPSQRFKKRLCWGRWRKVSRCRKAMGTHFLHLGHQKKRLGRTRFGDVLIRRMGLRTHNLPYGRLKKRLWSSRWSDVSRCLKAIRTHFLHP
jgi:hypothetical protein